jgi:hypothetical protein
MLDLKSSKKTHEQKSGGNSIARCDLVELGYMSGEVLEEYPITK